MVDIEIPRARVWVANVSNGQVAGEYAKSLAAMVAADLTNSWGMFQSMLTGNSGANISKARNEIVSRFLDQTDGEWLLWLDSDMVFPPDTIVRLLAAAQAADTKVIGGLCVMVTSDGPIPTLYQPAESPTDVTRVLLNAPDDQILQVAATGAACLMVHRDVFEAMREASPEDRLFCWFQEKVINTRWVSEDITFCLRANQLGYRVFVDTTLSIGHWKHGRVWHAADIGKGHLVSPAKTVAVIPTAGRDGMISDLVDQLVEQGNCDEIIVIDTAPEVIVIDTAPEGWSSSDGVTLLSGDPTAGIHAWWNQGIEYAIEEHGHRVRIAILNDDLRLGDGFMARMAEALDSGAPQLAAVSGNYDARPGAGLVQEVTDICAGRYDGTGGLAGFAFMVRGDWFTSGYRFPAECKWWYGDNDVVQAMVVGGYKVGIALRAEVEHLDGGGKTAGDWMAPEYAAQLEADREAFEARWKAYAAQRASMRMPAEDDWDPQALAAGASA